MLRAVQFAARLALLGPYHEFIVRRAVRATTRSLAGDARIDSVVHYGATYLDPRHLVIWFLLPTNKIVSEAKNDGFAERVEREVRVQLERYGYPIAALPHVTVGLESSENVRNAGGWRRYFH